MRRGFELGPEELARLRICHSKGLCDSCLGRCVAKKGHGLTNDERGAMVRDSFDEGVAQIKASDCWLCEGLVEEYDKFADLIVKAFAPYEYETYIIGTKIDRPTREREKEVQGIMEEGFEEFKSEVNREVGKLLGARTGKTVDFKRADIVAILDTRFDVVKIEVHSIFLYGRYRKLERGIPQTRWPCRSCMGKGCERCDGTGKMYETSVEELVSGPVVARYQASGQSFHGGGREDIDARMLGNGRPFVLEVKEPKRRNIDPEGLSDLMVQINELASGRVEISGLRTSDKDEVRAVKDLRCFKSYSVEVEFSQGVDEGMLSEALKVLEGTTIHQRTPIRVSHRRGDLVRKRLVRTIGGRITGPDSAILTVTGEAGIYIKELITGDEGRTEPSLANTLGQVCKVRALDVVQIHDEETEE